MAQLYADENFNGRVVGVLRQLGHDVLTAYEAGQANQRIPDSAVLAFATRAQRAVLTFNRRDFKRLHRTNQPHEGIITCTDDPDVTALAQRIHQALFPCTALPNVLIQITRPPSNP